MPELDCKRLYITDSIKSRCINCGTLCQMDYLSYPKVNEWFDLDFYCHECDNEWVTRAYLHIKLEIEE